MYLDITAQTTMLTYKKYSHSDMSPEQNEL